MRLNELSLKKTLIYFILAGALLIYITSGLLIGSTTSTQQEKLVYQESTEIARTHASQFNANMQVNNAIGKSIASTMIAYNSSDREEINSILRQILVDNPHLIGTYVGYEPNAFDGKDEQFVNADQHDETGRFIPYWNKIGGQMFVEPLLEYETSDYYQIPKNTHQEVMTEPYLYQGELIVSHVFPIIKNDEFVGIGGVDVSLNYINEEVSEVSIYESGYAFATSNNGILLSHPTNKELIGTDWLHGSNDAAIKIMLSDIEVGSAGNIETIDTITDKEVIMFYEPIQSGNYAFVLVIPKEEMLEGLVLLRTQLLLIFFGGLVFIGLMIVSISNNVGRKIELIENDVRDISRSVNEGDLGARANTNVSIDFRQMINGFNEVLENLQRSHALNEKMTGIIKNSPVIVFKWNEENRWPVEMVSENIRKFGYSPEDLMSSKITYADIVHPEDLKELEDLYNYTIAKKRKRMDAQYRIITGSEQILWVEERTIIQYDENEKVSDLQGIVVDITDRKNAERMKQEIMDVEDANRAKSKFLANMSHELRTPLNAVIGFSEMLQDQVFGELNEKQMKYMSNITSSGKHLLGLINDILDVTKIEAGKMELHYEEFNTGTDIKDIVASLMPLASEKEIEIVVDTSQDIPDITADKTKFKQMIYNLLSNAIKFTNTHGTISISTSANDKMIKIDIKDSGIGIDKEDLNKLFSPFSQIDSEATRQYQGTGLGLAIVKKFAQMHEGFVKVESEKGVGSTFSLSIPIKPSENNVLK